MIETDLGCFTFKTSVDSCTEDYDVNIENNCNSANISQHAYSVLKASAIAQYQSEMQIMEKLVLMHPLSLVKRSH